MAFDGLFCGTVLRATGLGHLDCHGDSWHHGGLRVQLYHYEIYFPEESVKRLRANLLLLLTAMIWGAAFVAQSVSMDYIGPFTFLCSRSILGGVVLLPVIAVMGKGKKQGTGQKPDNR